MDGISNHSVEPIPETSGLGKMSSAEASVILATRTAMGGVVRGSVAEDFGADDYIGGTLIVMKTLVYILPQVHLIDFLVTTKSERTEG
jgi:hypothetical protein